MDIGNRGHAMVVYKNRMVNRFICIIAVVCLFILLDSMPVFAKGENSKNGTESTVETVGTVGDDVATEAEPEIADISSDFVYDGLIYSIDDGIAATLIGSATEELETLIIPSVIIYDGTEIPVAGIGDYAFEGSSIANVTLGSNVKTVGEGAFAFSDNLKKVSINKRCKIIRDAAFFMCGELNTVKISKKAKTSIIGEGAFAGTAIKSFSMPNATVTVGSAAFGECTKLVSITIGNKLKTLGEGAFAGCNSLAKVTKSKKNKFFEVKENLIYSKNYVELVSAAAATGNTELYDGTECILPRAFEGNNRIVSVEVPASVESIGECAFMNCLLLETIILDGGLIEMDENAFYGCTKFSEIKFGNVDDDIVPVG